MQGSANANDAVVVSLVKPSSDGLKTIASFGPEHTYPIFGDEQRIFGYQNLKVSIRYHASDMRPNLQVSYSKKFKAVGDTEPTDIQEALEGFLPKGTLLPSLTSEWVLTILVALAKPKDFEEAIEQVPSDWTPPGTLVESFETKDGQYEIWKGSLADPAVKQMVNRIQILVSLFIEGGTPIKTEGDRDGEADPLDRWAVFFLYHKQKVLGESDKFSYVFAGYSTVYQFFLFQPPTPPATPTKQKAAIQPAANDAFELPKGKTPFIEFPCRSRISQFVIIPPYQGKGSGARLYSTIFKHYLDAKQTIEITVEDPNEKFDDLRDLSDLAFLQKIPEFNNLKINAGVTVPKTGPAPRGIVDQKALEALRLKYKIAPRQFARVTELHLMSKLPQPVRPGIEVHDSKKTVTKEQEHEYRLWKLLVKQRLYKHNIDALAQLEKPERIEKLDETLANVEFEYARLLNMYEIRSQRSEAVSSGKRKAVDETEENLNKRARVEFA